MSAEDGVHKPFFRERRKQPERRKHSQFCPLAMEHCPGMKPKEHEARFGKFQMWLIAILTMLVIGLLGNWGVTLQADVTNLNADVAKFKTDMAKHIASIDVSLNEVMAKLNNVTTVIIRR